MMRTPMWTMCRTLLIAGALALASASGPRADDSTFSDAAIKRAMPQGDEANRKRGSDERKPALVMKVLKEVQRRTCRTAPSVTPRPPNTSWPARGQAAISICQ